MKIEEAFWQTEDGVRLYTRSWLCEGEPRASIVLVHGLGEHCARYDHVARTFTAHHFNMIAFDQRGHGRSDGKRGDIPGLNTALYDIDHFLELAQSAHLPTFLYGHSLGGLEVLFYTLKRQPEVAGVICTSPALAIGAPVPPFKVFLARALSRIAPGLQMNNGLDVNNLSHNQEVIKAYTSDPLVTPLISARLGLDLIQTGPWVMSQAERFPVPLLLMQGTEDHLVSPQATRLFAEKVPPHLLTFREWPGLYHELHNEPQQEEVLAFIVQWIKKTLGDSW